MSGHDGQQRSRKAKAVSASRSLVEKHKYALAFWLMSIFALAMTIWSPPARSHGVKPVKPVAAIEISTVRTV
jgi:hypothetical protein